MFARPIGSPYAHAFIKKVDSSAALQIPGVVAVLTADDLPIADRAAAEAGKWPIAFGEALYVGQFVAIVLAESERRPRTAPKRSRSNTKSSIGQDDRFRFVVRYGGGAQGRHRRRKRRGLNAQRRRGFGRR